MCNNGARALLLIVVTSILVIPAFGQRQYHPTTPNTVPCGAPNGDGQNSTNYYSSGDPCAFTYNVPEERRDQLLIENSQCTMFSRTMVNCSKAVKGNYGQIQLDRRDGAGAGGGRNPGSVPQTYPSAPTPPHLSAMPEAQRGNAEQLYQRASALVDRNNYRDALPLLLQAGRLGHPRAQATLGIAYQDGNGVRADDRAAAYWFGLAAAQGHRAAQYALAAMYEEGEGGLPRDRAKAAELYIKSARQGFDKAQMALGISYEVGDGVPRSRQQAIALLRQSGLGVNIAAVLATPGTPARFADVSALAAYLRKLRDAETAKSAARAGAASRPGIGSNAAWELEMRQRGIRPGPI